MKQILIASTIVFSLILSGCGEEEKKVEPKAEEKSTMDIVKEASSKVTQTVSKAASEVSTTVAETTKEVVEKTKPVIEQKVEEVKKAASDVSATVVETTKEVVEKTKPVVEQKVQEVKKAVVEVMPNIAKKEIDAKSLYTACSACHGQNAEKAALGKSQIIKGWSSEKIIEALNGYKDGTYGGAMKGIMKGQVATKSEDEIKALAEYIASF
jgi:cytochrome c553